MVVVVVTVVVVGVVVVVVLVVVVSTTFVVAPTPRPADDISAIELLKLSTAIVPLPTWKFLLVNVPSRRF